MRSTLAGAVGRQNGRTDLYARTSRTGTHAPRDRADAPRGPARAHLAGLYARTSRTRTRAPRAPVRAHLAHPYARTSRTRTRAWITPPYVRTPSTSRYAEDPAVRDGGVFECLERATW
ncbi:hypothetical protein ACGFRG_27550 [Streptomyces sp. NPDC048696]|uniref:hypothetical protein n=1 Tax=Streptomyces sp. NPDC048696 TaxID=3365585 RepID=UPI00371E3C7B